VFKIATPKAPLTLKGLQESRKKIVLEDAKFLSLILHALETWLRPLKIQQQRGVKCLHGVPAIDALFEMTEYLEYAYVENRHFFAFCHLAWFWHTDFNSFYDRWVAWMPNKEYSLLDLVFLSAQRIWNFERLIGGVQEAFGAQRRGLTGADIVKHASIAEERYNKSVHLAVRYRNISSRTCFVSQKTK
jgi:hypothetical protein